MFDAAVFRRYDIRGVAGSQISEDLATAVARSLGTRIFRAGGREAAVGRDVRHSSPGLAAAAAAGLAASGLHVHDLGQVPTPVVYHALHRRALGGGIMVTGSHNPKEYNGLKLCLGTEPLFGDAVASLRTQSQAEDWVRGQGKVTEDSHLDRYLDELAGRFRFAGSRSVAVDAGNGVMGPVVLELFGRLGLTTVPLYCDPDGDFPNHIPDPEVPAYMRSLGQAVVKHGCGCGLGFDGDGDRVGVLDEKGRKISADWLLALFARRVLKKHPGGMVRFDVKCSDFLAQDIAAHGGVPVMGETGHSLLKRDVKKLDAVLGGELSGHIVFNRGYVPIDDSLWCALVFLQILEESGGTASDLFRDFPETFSTAEIKVPCPDAAKFRVVEELVRNLDSRFDIVDLDGARVSLPDGWFLVRASNTTPNLTVRFESCTAEGLLRARDLLKTALATHPEVDADILDDLESHR